MVRLATPGKAAAQGGLGAHHLAEISRPTPELDRNPANVAQPGRRRSKKPCDFNYAHLARELQKQSPNRHHGVPRD
jgi:hypothetical protein